jgi:hypothetical protein
MATFRKLHVSFWSDAYISELSESEKLFYIYLLTNERTTQCGIYEITKRQIAFDLGYSIDTVSILLKKFEQDGKILYCIDKCYVAIRNWNFYNKNESPKVQSFVNKELAKIKDERLIQYVYNIDTVPILNPKRKEEEEEINKEKYTKENLPLEDIPVHNPTEVKPKTSRRKKSSQEKWADIVDGQSTPAEKPERIFKFRENLLLLKADEKLVDEWLTVRKNKKATNSETAFRNFLKEFRKTDLTINQVLEKCVVKSWSGFEAKFLEANGHLNGNSQNKPFYDSPI